MVSSCKSASKTRFDLHFQIKLSLTVYFMIRWSGRLNLTNMSEYGGKSDFDGFRWRPSWIVIERSYSGCCHCHHWIQHPRKHGFSHQDIVSIYPRGWVTSRNVFLIISRRPFWKWRHTGSSSQFGDGGTHFSWPGIPKEQKKVGLILSWGGCTVSLCSPCTTSAQARVLHCFSANPSHLAVAH